MLDRNLVLSPASQPKMNMYQATHMLLKSDTILRLLFGRKMPSRAAEDLEEEDERLREWDRSTDALTRAMDAFAQRPPPAYSDTPGLDYTQQYNMREVYNLLETMRRKNGQDSHLEWISALSIRILTLSSLGLI